MHLDNYFFVFFMAFVPAVLADGGMAAEDGVQAQGESRVWHSRLSDFMVRKGRNHLICIGAKDSGNDRKIAHRFPFYKRKKT
jgi:hypothetical protein